MSACAIVTLQNRPPKKWGLAPFLLGENVWRWFFFLGGGNYFPQLEFWWLFFRGFSRFFSCSHLGYSSFSIFGFLFRSFIWDSAQLFSVSVTPSRETRSSPHFLEFPSFSFYRLWTLNLTHPRSSALAPADWILHSVVFLRFTLWLLFTSWKKWYSTVLAFFHSAGIFLGRARMNEGTRRTKNENSSPPIFVGCCCCCCCCRSSDSRKTIGLGYSR